MPTLRTRASKGSELTHNELDANFKRTVSQKTTTYACLVGDNRSIIEGNHATTPFTITLGDAATMQAAETGDYEVTITNINAAAVTVAPAGADTINGGTGSLVLEQNDSAKFIVNSAGNGYQTLGFSRVNIGTVQATTSGTSITFASLPPGIKRITVMLSGVSTSGTDLTIIRLGDAGGVETSGYSSQVVDNNSGTTHTDGYHICETGLAGGATRTGIVNLSLIDSATNTWICSSLIGIAGTFDVHYQAGTKALSAVLDRVVLTTDGGTDTFDAGSMNIQYEV